jgi:DNA replication protein DnaC
MRNSQLFGIALSEAGVQKRFSDARFPNGQSDIDRFKASLQGGTNIFITGPVGVGKSHISSAMIRWGVYHGYRALIVPWVSYLTEVKDTFDTNKTPRRLKSEDIVILDDVGAEKVSDFSIQMLYEIVEHRTSAMKTVVVVSNLNSRAFADVYGGPIASRVMSGDIIKLEGADRRIQHHRRPS